MPRRDSPADADVTAHGPDHLTTLAQAALTGEPDHTRRFLDAIVPSLRSICQNTLGGNHPDLDDTLQECLVAVLRALPKYRFESPVLHYVNRISLRIAIAARQRRRGTDKGLHAFASAAAQSDVSEPNADTLAMLLRRIVDELPTEQAEAIILRMMLGYSFEEMAEHMQVPVGTAKSRLRLAKDALRELLDEVPSLKGGVR